MQIAQTQYELNLLAGLLVFRNSRICCAFATAQPVTIFS